MGRHEKINPNPEKPDTLAMHMSIDLPDVEELHKAFAEAPPELVEEIDAEMSLVVPTGATVDVATALHETKDIAEACMREAASGLLGDVYPALVAAYTKGHAAGMAEATRNVAEQ